MLQTVGDLAFDWQLSGKKTFTFLYSLFYTLIQGTSAFVNEKLESGNPTWKVKYECSRELDIYIFLQSGDTVWRFCRRSRFLLVLSVMLTCYLLIQGQGRANILGYVVRMDGIRPLAESSGTTTTSWLMRKNRLLGETIRGMDWGLARYLGTGVDLYAGNL